MSGTLLMAVWFGPNVLFITGLAVAQWRREHTNPFAFAAEPELALCAVVLLAGGPPILGLVLGMGAWDAATGWWYDRHPDPGL